ncbi:MAG: glycosyltransferase family 2 protein [Candidatus Dadabacteria bacterium]|nr:MAG: glycosyltransferase family 2 protein [Candidatus Dadabacteria bacterium]
MEVSVIIPAYNRREMLLRAVKSVLRQDYKDYELIVVNDGSEEDLSDVKTLVLESGNIFTSHEYNRGVAAARNTGIKLSRGRWVAFLDSDDLWYPEKLRKQMEYHNRNSDILISQCEEVWFRRGVMVNKKKDHLQPEGDAFLPSLRLCCISSSSVLMHRSVIEQCGLQDERFRVCEDYEFWLRVTSRYLIGLVRKPLVEKYGGHQGQLSASEKALDRYRCAAIIKLIARENLLPEQLGKALEELKTKASILLHGALKRRSPLKGLYKRVIDAAERIALQEDLHKSCKLHNLLELERELLSSVVD